LQHTSAVPLLGERGHWQGRDMNQHTPPRFADPDQARRVAQAFDLRRLPADYYANPYPTYHALREHAPVHRLPDGVRVHGIEVRGRLVQHD